MSTIVKSIKMLNMVVNLILGDDFTRPIEHEMLKRHDCLFPY
jgi:hypothetical protein